MKTFLDYSIIITVWFGVVVGCAAPQPQPVVYTKLKEASVEILLNGRLAGSGSVVDAQGHVFIANHMVPGDGAKVEAQSTALGVILSRSLRGIAPMIWYCLSYLRATSHIRIYPWPKPIRRLGNRFICLGRRSFGIM